MHTQQKFEHFLIRKQHSEKTRRSYLYAVKNFLAVCPKAEKYAYKDVINYWKDKAGNGRNQRTVVVELAAVKKYYDFLIETGVREDHPCRSMFFKGAGRSNSVMHIDLFTSAELEMLMEREERYAALKLKNQALVSLLIYQGLVPHEIVDMKVHHVDLDTGKLFVKESRMLSRRHLHIEPRQYRILDRYISDTRNKLISVPTDALLVGKLGTPITVDDVHYIISTYKPLFQDRNLTPTVIRQSVIANWMNEKGLPIEQVQLMAGHRWISTTLRYRQSNHDQSREMINKWHPLG